MNDSWTWKTLLKLRPLAERFVKCSVGNGKIASFWFDSCTPLGPLIKVLGEEGPRSSRIPLNAKVADACNQQGWILASPRSEQAMALHSHLTTIRLPSNSTLEDTYCWIVNDVKCRGFSSKLMLEAARPREEVKDWFNSVWFKGATPKHAFTMWTAQLDRLPTPIRLASWGMLIPTTCCLCSAFDETRNHLFLHCEYNKDLWHAIQQRIGLSPTTFQYWTNMLTWLFFKDFDIRM